MRTVLDPAAPRFTRKRDQYQGRAYHAFVAALLLIAPTSAAEAVFSWRERNGGILTAHESSLLAAAHAVFSDYDCRPVFANTEQMAIWQRFATRAQNKSADFSGRYYEILDGIKFELPMGGANDE